MTDTPSADVLPDSEVAGLSAKTVAHVIHYRRKTYVTKPSEGYALLKRVRTLLRDGSTDLVPLVHRDGFVWLVVGPGIPVAVDEVETDAGHSEKHTLKRLGLD
jgi:DNA-binding response OmpR family regulator